MDKYFSLIFAKWISIKIIQSYYGFKTIRLTGYLLSMNFEEGMNTVISKKYFERYISLVKSNQAEDVCLLLDL